MSEPLLSLQDVRVSLGVGSRAQEVLHGISLEVGAGQVLGVIGETGSGKTTLARTVVGIHRPASGRVAFEGTDVSALRRRELRAFRRRGRVQYIFQDPLQSLDPDQTVRASVAEPLAAAGLRDRAELDARVNAALERALLDPALGARFPQQLSGGQRQRVLIARGLVSGPRLILADEPVSALDAESRIQILDVLRSLAVDDGIGVVFISHDVGSVAGIADRIAVLYRGSLVEEGPSERVVRAPSHPYTRLLLSSVPSFQDAGVPAAERAQLRRALRAELAEATAG